ncbi:MAG: radical SAM protein [Saccharofermentanales bacterium]
MKLMGLNELLYLRRNLQQVKHVTLDPDGPGVVRIHLIPPAFSLNKDTPAVMLLNGQDLLPVDLSWAILLSEFIDAITLFAGREISEGDWDTIIAAVLQKMRQVYKDLDEQTMRKDLWRILGTAAAIASGKKPEEAIGLISIGGYAPHMKAPHRMDLMISSMTKDGAWHCNQRCLYCYAAGQTLAEVKELTTEEWKKIIAGCRKAGIPQLTFTGGEPTLREDLVELVEYSRWFITRLNTNGVRLTEELCGQLLQASLDSVQITFYSNDPGTHNKLVGAGNWDRTVTGIRNALKANLNVSINTPLCGINCNYVDTLRFAGALGIRYVSCSGLISAGNALTQDSGSTTLPKEELDRILTDAFQYCKENQMEISFTSPGCMDEKRLFDIGFTSIPSCGACLSNMAVTPDGKAVPCQSWLSGEPLGDMLHDSWRSIWNSRNCRDVRNRSARMEQICLLRHIAQEDR